MITSDSAENIIQIRMVGYFAGGGAILLGLFLSVRRVELAPGVMVAEVNTEKSFVYYSRPSVLVRFIIKIRTTNT